MSDQRVHDPETQHVPTGKLAFSWILVSIPLLWGVYQTVLKSIPLFVR